MFRKAFIALMVTGAVAACDSGTDVDGAASVGISFTTTSQVGGSAALASQESANSLVVTGSNGTLTIDGIHVIVAEFELEGALAACDEAFDDDDCEEVESGPFLAQIPTDGGALNVATAWVPLGSYTELEWEVEDLDFEDDDFDDRDVQAVRSDIDALVGAGVWPAEASMVVTGSFLADGETTPTPFTTFFAAEIEVEMDLVPPLDLTEEGASRDLTIVLSPEIWFRNADGTVMNLAALSDQLVEFEAEFEDGIIEIEIDDDD